jgi:hypothetical protein
MDQWYSNHEADGVVWQALLQLSDHFLSAPRTKNDLLFPI